MVFDIFKINSIDGERKYTDLLSFLNVKNPYSQIDYLDIFSDGLKSVNCFSYHNVENNTRIIMTVHIKPIIISNEETVFFDAITPYGYSGPISSKDANELDFVEFWKNVDKWYLKNNVVTEFVRFNLSNNHLNYSGKIFRTMLNIKGKIIKEDEQLKSFNRKVRKNVNKAVREKLESFIYYKNISDNKILEFYDIYRSTMIRTNAVDKFHYSLDDFKRFIKFNDEFCAICTVSFNNIPITSELVLVSEDSIYSFLGGTDEKYFDKRPNDFLKVSVINWARNGNFKYYILGGGNGFEDGIFKYKKCFFPEDVVDYYTGRKIINKDVYNSLLLKTNQIRMSHELDDENEKYFPLYRVPLGSTVKP